MPKRKSTIRINSESVQGDDSFVVLRRLTVGEMKSSMSAPDDEDGIASFSRSLKMYYDHVVEWNWVDDDDAPLPQLKDDPELVDRLTDAEVLFLARGLAGAEEELKN